MATTVAKNRSQRVLNPEVKERREPTLLQKKDGRWFVRFRHRNSTKDFSLGIKSVFLAPDFVPQGSDAANYVYDGRRYAPQEVYKKYSNDYSTPLFSVPLQWSGQADRALPLAADSA